MEYYRIMRMKSNYFELRLRMVMLAREEGISESARRFETTRVTVRKWLRRFEEESSDGLKDRSRRPKHSPNKLSKRRERRIVELRKKHPSWGPDRLMEHYGLKCAPSTIGRVIKRAGLSRHRKKKKRRYKDYTELRRLKRRLKPFELIQIDTKVLTDIPVYVRQMRQGVALPKYQFTARDVRTGGMWFAYAKEGTSTNAALFAMYLADHLKHYGVDLKNISFQTDNGSEYIGSIRKRGDSMFQKTLKRYGIHHARIPSHSPTFNSDVEASHRLVEDEFYECELYRDATQFYAKAYAYQLYFNYERKNMWRNKKSPVIINTELGGKINRGVFNLPPPLLDNAVKHLKGGYHVSKEVTEIPDTS